MEGKVCVVTGANSGIGKVMATEFARRGASVVMVARNKNAGADALEHVRQTATGEVSLELADLSSLGDLRALAQRLSERFERIDVLMNNAGIYLAKRHTTPEGFEFTFTVNHLAPFVLTNLMLDRLAKAPGARVITTTSIAYQSAKLDCDDLMMDKRKFGGLRQYANAKLGNILFTQEASRRFQERGVTINCFHPGPVKTGIAQDEPNFIGFMTQALGWMFLKSPAKGADTGLYLATAPEVRDVSGQYFVKREVGKLKTAEASDAELARRLWAKSAELTGIEA